MIPEKTYQPTHNANHGSSIISPSQKLNEEIDQTSSYFFWNPKVQGFFFDLSNLEKDFFASIV